MGGGGGEGGEAIEEGEERGKSGTVGGQGRPSASRPNRQTVDKKKTSRQKSQ